MLSACIFVHHMHAVPAAEEGTWFPEPVFQGGSEPLLSAGNWTWVLYESSQCLWLLCHLSGPSALFFQGWKLLLVIFCIPPLSPCFYPAVPSWLGEHLGAGMSVTPDVMFSWITESLTIAHSLQWILGYTFRHHMMLIFGSTENVCKLFDEGGFGGASSV